MVAESGNAVVPDPPRVSSSYYKGRLRNGKLYCNCGLQANCRTIQKQCPTLGMKFWRCPKEKDGEGVNKQCNFYLWVEHEPEARRWLEKNGAKDDPETPTKQREKSNNLQTPASMKSLENPWTKSKRKRVPEEILEGAGFDHQHNGGPGEDERIGSPAGKKTKNTVFVTASQTLTEKLKAASAGSLPTPEAGGKATIDLTASPLELRRRESAELSPTPNPNHPRSRRSDRQSDLATTILKILDESSVDLKEATKIEIQHEIELELDTLKAANLAREKRYKETISTLSYKVEVFENIAGLLTEGATLDDAVELSD